jgi:hypothetical protein
MSTLTADQPWLLLHMGGWAIIDALLSPAGTDQLMGRMWGSSGGEPPAGAPERLRGWDTRGGKIVSPWRGEPRRGHHPSATEALRQQPFGRYPRGTR